jgi:hypothetical protein
MRRDFSTLTERQWTRENALVSGDRSGQLT